MSLTKLLILPMGATLASARLRILQYRDYLRENAISCSTTYPYRDKTGPITKLISAQKEYSNIVKSMARSDVCFMQKRLFSEIFWSRLKKVDIPLIFDLDDFIFAKQYENQSWFMARRTRKRLMSCFSRCSAIIAGNENLAAAVADFGFGDRVHIIPTGLDVDKYCVNARASKTDPSQLVLGWIGHSKNFEYLRPIFEEIEKDGRLGKIQLAIMADKPIEGLPISVAQRFSKWTERGEAKFLSSIDIGLQPLDNSRWARGKCSFKAIQYMASGIPVLTSNVGSAAWTVGDGGVVVKDSRDWSEAILGLQNKPQLLSSLGLQGQKRARELFDLPIVGESILNVIRKVV